MENNDLKENIRKNIKEKIAVSNIRKEFYMKNNINNKIFYTAISACALFVICVGIGINLNLKPSENITISKENENDIVTIAEEKKQEDNIIFNNHGPFSTASIDAKFIETNIMERFEIFNNIYVPIEYNLYSQGEVYTRKELGENEYSHLRQYEINYSKNNDNSSIQIVITKEDKKLDDIFFDEETMISSTINGQEIKLSKATNPEDNSKVSARAIFKKDDYKFYVEVYKMTEEEFIKIVKSIV